jgi:hypothetical protein
MHALTPIFFTWKTQIHARKFQWLDSEFLRLIPLLTKDEERSRGGNKRRSTGFAWDIDAAQAIVIKSTYENICIYCEKSIFLSVKLNGVSKGSLYCFGDWINGHIKHVLRTWQEDSLRFSATKEKGTRVAKVCIRFIRWTWIYNLFIFI